MKRSLDILIAIILIIPFGVIVLFAAILIKLGSPGPVLFAQKRLGRNGRPFTMLKFRTMVTNAEQMPEGLFSYADDPRVTWIGRRLRATSIDELPQLINVLCGDMSVVGPRPPVTNELGDYDNLTEERKIRFMVKPGITGLAQVSGRNYLDWSKKIIYDNCYIENFRRRGIFEDLRILMLTLGVVINMKGIIERKPEV
ncbi:MAG TPA: sugar transferase [Deltaproteobacteria bacterium]|nr:sugar transferase [Deltaproteobacteria bacterium]